jgi:hypothetical protein
VKIARIALLACLALVACEKRASDTGAAVPQPQPAPASPAVAPAAQPVAPPIRGGDPWAAVRAELALAIERGKGEVSCQQNPTALGTEVLLRGRGEVYPLGTFAMNEAPAARHLAQSVANIYHRFGAQQLQSGGEASLQVKVLASADANPMAQAIRYMGPRMGCDTGGRRVDLNPDYTRIDNALLGCARAAAFHGFLVAQGMPASAVGIGGRELLAKGGAHRYIEVSLKFRAMGVPELCP